MSDLHTQELERMLNNLRGWGIAPVRWHFPRRVAPHNITEVMGLPVCCCEFGSNIVLEGRGISIWGTYHDPKTFADEEDS
jgi:hypothetical protein